MLDLAKIARGEPTPRQPGKHSIKMKQAANRPILTLLFHEQPMSEIRPARTDRP